MRIPKSIYRYSFLTLLLLLTGCGTKEPPEGAKVPEASAIAPAEKTTPSHPYPDSVVETLVQETLERNRPITIDSARDLHAFDKAKFNISGASRIDLALVDRYQDIDNPVTLAQKQLLGVTDYFADLTFADGFDMFLFYNRSEESHYGNSIDLVTIAKQSNQFHRLTLAQEYLSEGYEYTLESELLGKDRIRTQKVEYFGIANTRAEVDSVRTSEVIYQVNEDGGIRKVKE